MKHFAGTKTLAKNSYFWGMSNYQLYIGDQIESKSSKIIKELFKTFDINDTNGKNMWYVGS